MRLSIPDYERVARPLQALLKEQIRSGGSMKASVLKRLSIRLGDDQRASFEQLKNRIDSRMRLQHFDPEDESKVLVLTTDASVEGWSGILTMMQKEDYEQGRESHEPVAFVSGAFDETQQRWSTIEQEAYAVLTAMERLRAWTLTTTVRIRTDSKNVVYIWKPMPAAVATRLGLSDVAKNKLARWGLKLSAFDYVLTHVQGEVNHLPDMLSRWGQARPTIRMVKHEHDQTTCLEGKNSRSLFSRS